MAPDRGQMLEILLIRLLPGQMRSGSFRAHQRMGGSGCLGTPVEITVVEANLLFQMGTVTLDTLEPMLFFLGVFQELVQFVTILAVAGDQGLAFLGAKSAPWQLSGARAVTTSRCARQEATQRASAAEGFFTCFSSQGCSSITVGTCKLLIGYCSGKLGMRSNRRAVSSSWPSASRERTRGRKMVSRSNRGTLNSCGAGLWRSIVSRDCRIAPESRVAQRSSHSLLSD